MRGGVKYIVFALIILVSILWLGGFLYKRVSTQEIKQEEKIVQGLEIGKVEKVAQAESAYAATVVADKRAEIASRIAGRVVSVEVKEGDCVAKGKLLVSIDAQDIRSQVQALEKQKGQAEYAYQSALAQYEAVEKTYQRYSILLEKGAITQQEFDQIKAQFESAQAQVRQARAGIEAINMQKQAIASNLSYANITAPFSGCVVSKMVDVGDLALPEQPLIIFEGVPYKVEAHLPERLIEKVKVGQVFKVVGDRVWQGKVIEKSEAIDPVSRTFRVKLSIPSEGLRSGALVKVLIPEEKESLLVPKSAVVKRFDFTGVWVVKEDNTLELRFVKLGEGIGDDKVEVLSGLKEGERIVVGGVVRACEGCKVGG